MDSKRISEFIRQYIPARETSLQNLRDAAGEKNIPIIREETERFLQTVIMLVRPRRILELGTAIGYSAVFMAQTAEDLEVIDTIEDWKPRISQAQVNIDRSGLGEKINLIEGDALEVMKKLEEPYDLIFIDAAKGQYPDYLQEAVRLTHRGSVIVADNILQDGEILESKFSVVRRDRTIHKRLREFLGEISMEKKLVTSIVPIGDGLTFSVRC